MVINGHEGPPLLHNLRRTLFFFAHFPVLQSYFGSNPPPEALCQTSEAPCRAVLARPVSATFVGPGKKNHHGEGGADGDAFGTPLLATKLAKPERRTSRHTEFGHQVTLKTLKKLIPGGHYEAREGTADEAATYCKKDKNYIEEGTISQKTRSTQRSTHRG